MNIALVDTLNAPFVIKNKRIILKLFNADRPYFVMESFYLAWFSCLVFRLLIPICVSSWGAFWREEKDWEKEGNLQSHNALQLWNEMVVDKRSMVILRKFYPKFLDRLLRYSSLPGLNKLIENYRP